MKPLSPKHLKFIELVVSGKPQGEAYKLSIGKSGVSRAVADVKASQLCKRYASQIASEREKIQQIVTGARDSEVVRIALKSVLSEAEVDAKLSAIVNGELLEVQLMNLTTGKTYKAKVTPSVSDITKAIDLYYKRFGSNAPSKTDITSGGKELVINWQETHPNEPDDKTK